MPTDRQTRPTCLSPTATVYDVIGSDGLGPCQDWRDLIVRVADLCMRRVYRSEADPCEWGRPVNRQVLEGLLDAPELPTDLAVGELQQMTQAAMNETENMHAILGAALVMSWPSSPVGLADWPDRAIVLSGLRNDRAGVHARPVGLEMRRAQRGATSSAQYIWTAESKTSIDQRERAQCPVPLSFVARWVVGKECSPPNRLDSNRRADCGKHDPRHGESLKQRPNARGVGPIRRA